MNVHKLSVETSKWKTSLGRSRHRWEGNVEIDLEEVVYEGMGRTEQGSVSRCFEHGNEPSGSTESGEFINLMSH
jgi:hypothetical protein